MAPLRDKLNKHFIQTGCGAGDQGPEFVGGTGTTRAERFYPFGPARRPRKQGSGKTGTGERCVLYEAFTLC